MTEIKTNAIPHRLKNVNKEHPYVAGAGDIIDDAKGKTQEDVNKDVDNEFAFHQSEINALDSQNYATVGTFSELPATGSVDTIYRVSNWDGSANSGAGAVDATVYSEYAWDDSNSEYKLLDVKTAIGEVFDISLYHASGGVLAEYADLAAALGASGANVPAGVRKGGMSVKFVQSSDNNYVQYRYMLDDATDVSDFTNTDNWSFCGNDVYVENPEFVKVTTDKDGRILLAVEKDGNVMFGTGVPQQIIDYITEKIEELSLDEYEDIVAFLDSLITGDKTLAELLDEKVDKVEGESLINADYADTKNAIENPEYLEVTTDDDNRIIEGIRTDGIKEINTPINANAGNVNLQGMDIKVIDNPEFLNVELDNKNRILSATRKDGSHYIHNVESETLDVINAKLDTKVDKEEGKQLSTNDYTNNEKEIVNTQYLTENPEYIQVEIDADNRILGGRKPDGKKFEAVGFDTPNISVDGNSVETREDIEDRIEMKLDADERIITYRTADGTLHENVGIVTPKIVLSDSGLTDLQQALRRTGFGSGVVGDLSNSDHIELPEPKHYGLLNLIIPFTPRRSDDVAVGYAEYYDNYGNYFKIPCEITTQGQSSQYFASTGGKGNFTLDVDRDIKFGTWVPQDSFHLKGCAKDVTRGYLSTSYKWAYKFMQALDAKPNRVLLKSDARTTTTHASGDRFTDWPSDARCLPDGFPIELYFNGEYYGLYALQLKKHRKNYSMKKSDYTSFFLDADSFGMDSTLSGGFWTGDIPWTRFEIKNPKDLICMDGSNYDGDHPQELIDSSSDYYNPNNAKHVGSAQTKAIIQSWPTKYAEIKTLIDAGTIESLAEAKTKFADYFDVNSCMLVYIFNCLNANGDSINKNTMWGTYKNGKIFCALWDLDGMYGEGWIGITADGPTAYLWEGSYATSSWPLALFWTLYETEIKAKYAELRTNGVISIDTWHDIIFGQWVERIGTEAYERDNDRWPETPSYRKNYTKTDYWQESGIVTADVIAESGISEWNANTQYEQGDVCTLCINQTVIYMKYIAIQASQNKCPVTKYYTQFPAIGGYFNSPKRMEKWLEAQIALCDTKLGYIPQQ